MAVLVKVTRRGQTTIPKKYREKLNIKEGDELLVEIKGNMIIFTPIPKLDTLAGADAEYDDVEEVKAEVEKVREEY